MKRTFLPVFLIFFTLAAPGIKAGLLMTPYLQAASENSIYIMAECDSQSPLAAVEYGPTAGYGFSVTTESVDATTQPTYIHKIKVTGLSPGAIYHYRVSHGASVSGDHTFKTAAPAGAPFRFAFMADCQSGVLVHAAVASGIASGGPDFSIYGGDLCSAGDYNSFKDEFFIGNELNLISSVPFFLSPGNHEGWSTNTKAFTRAPASSSGTQDYYSFDWGDAHFLILNTEEEFGTGSSQYNFAEADLAGTVKKWKIAVFHKPAYAEGGTWWGPEQPTKALAEHVLAPGGVQLVLAGHMHYYQHNYASGVHHLVVSPAGGDEEQPRKASYTITMHKGSHYALADVGSDSLCVRIYSHDGSIVDTVSFPYTGALPTPVISAPPVGIDNVYVYPALFRLKRGDKIMKFGGLEGAGRVELKVFNITGELVYETAKDQAEGYITWNIENSRITSGVYVYVVKNEAGAVKKGKFAVER